MASNTELLSIVAEIEQKLLGDTLFEIAFIRSRVARTLFHALKMVTSLEALAGEPFPALRSKLESLELAIREQVHALPIPDTDELVLPLARIDRRMAAVVGGKSANLGEIRNGTGLPIPEGFAVTTRAFRLFLDQPQVKQTIATTLATLEVGDPHRLEAASEMIQRAIINAPLPLELERALLRAFDELQASVGQHAAESPAAGRVAMRSSAIGEDGDLSFAGQYLSVLNVARNRLAESYKYVVASLYTPRAIAYRHHQGVGHDDSAMGVACLQMVSSVASGVIYSRHPLANAQDAVIVSAVWGLGPYAVDGRIATDTYRVQRGGQFAILQKQIADKPVQLVSLPESGLGECPVTEEARRRPCLSDEQIRILASWAMKLESHYNEPQDIEWALAPADRLLLLQTRPLPSALTAPRVPDAASPALPGTDVLLEGGEAAALGIGHGRAYHVRRDDDLKTFPDGAVLVARHSSPKYVVAMRKAAAIVTDAGSVTGHMASLCREFAVPALLNTKRATELIPDGAEITVDAHGSRIYRGNVPVQAPPLAASARRHRHTSAYILLQKVAALITPLNLLDPKSPDFKPECCLTIHDIMRFVHEQSYMAMFRIGQGVAGPATGVRKLTAPIPLDLYVLDLGEGLVPAAATTRSRVSVRQVASVPFKALLEGLLDEALLYRQPRPVDLSGFFSVMQEQLTAANQAAEGLGDRSYALISDRYLNFSSRVGYHFSVLDAYCGLTVNKNYISFSFKGGAAEDVRRQRRARAIAEILASFDFAVETQADQVTARFQKYECPEIEQRLRMLGRLLQFTRQMDMLMVNDAMVAAVVRAFLTGDYALERLERT